MVKASFPLKMSRLVMKGRSTGKGGSLIRLELEGLIDKVNVSPRVRNYPLRCPVTFPMNRCLKLR